MSEDLLKEALPEPWTLGVSDDGRVFYINDEEKRTTWLHPDTGEAVRTGFRQREDLPKGWEEGFTSTGQPYYINHNNQTTTFTFPEKPIESNKGTKKSKKSKEERLYQKAVQVSSGSDNEASIDNDTLRREKKSRRNSSFLERSGINIFRRSSSKSRERPEEIKTRPARKMKEKREKPHKKNKSSRPTSATSVRSNSSTMSFRSKLTASRRDNGKDVSKSGWLYKQDSTGKMKMWRKKWFVLADFCLYYYKDSKEGEVLGSIILPSYTVSTLTADDKINRKYAFKVEHDGMRSYYLSADSYNDMTSWITALQKSCHPITPTLNKPSEKASEKVDGSRKTETDDGKGGDSSKAKKKEAAKGKKEEDSDSEFGFNHVKSRPRASDSSSPSTDMSSRKNEKQSKSPVKNTTKNNKSQTSPAKRIDRSPEKEITPRRVQESHQQQAQNQGYRPYSEKVDQRHPYSDPRYFVPRHQDRVPNLRQQPQQKNARRENGESAYFSDTSGATDNSNPQQRPMTAEQQRKIQRQNSLAKLQDWAMNQKLKQQQQSGSTVSSPQRMQPPSNFDTASEFSSVSQQYSRKSATLAGRGPQKMGPPSTRRYRARTYNEYMDPMEVASSTISMPPIQNTNRMNGGISRTLPRPQSSENMRYKNHPNRRPDQNNRMVSSKSAGNIVAVDQYGVPISPRQTVQPRFDHSKRAKSDYIHQNQIDLQQQYIASFKKAQAKENKAFHAPRQQQRSHSRPQSAGRSSNNGSVLSPRRSHQPQRSGVSPNDVFSPASDLSSSRSGRSSGGQVFRYDVKPNTLSPGERRPNTLPQSPGTHASNYEVKQVQRGGFRAFVLSAKSPQSQLPPPQRQTPLKSTENVIKSPSHHITNERDIEARLRKLTESEKAFQKKSDDVDALLSEKDRLVADLSIARSKLQSRYSSGSTHVDTKQHKLEQELGSVKAQLAYAAEKLSEMKHSSERFEDETRRLKSGIFEELRSMSGNTNQEKEAKRRLEWEFGRVGFIIEGIGDLKSKITKKLDEIDRNRDDESPLASPTSPPSLLSANSRSPRDVKRTSMERRSLQNRPSQSSSSSGGTPNTTPVKKYYTLPSRGVPRATSVDSITAENLAKSSPRPTSARSGSSIASSTGTLQRTKSASERLFNSQYGNQRSEQEARDIKKIQKEILRNRRNNLKTGGAADPSHRHSSPSGMTLPTRSHMKVGIDVQMALKHHRMPKVLQRAKRDRAEAQNQISFDIDDLERQVTGKQRPVPSGLYEKDSLYFSNQVHDEEDGGSKVRHVGDVDDESDEIHVDVNLTHQLLAPDKVEIPERYIEYENVELTPAEEKKKHKKVAAIEKMLAKSGQPASLPAVHLAAALAVEAGSVARVVAMHASAPQQQLEDENSNQRPVTDGSSSTEEDLDMEPPLMMPDLEYQAACIV